MPLIALVWREKKNLTIRFELICKSEKYRYYIKSLRSQKYSHIFTQLSKYY